MCFIPTVDPEAQGAAITYMYHIITTLYNYTMKLNVQPICVIILKN